MLRQCYVPNDLLAPYSMSFILMDGVSSFPPTQTCLYNWWELILLGKKISTLQSTLHWAVTRSPPQCTGAGSEVGVPWPHQCVCPRPLGIWLQLIAYTWEQFKSQRSTVADLFNSGSVMDVSLVICRVTLFLCLDLKLEHWFIYI